MNTRATLIIVCLALAGYINLSSEIKGREHLMLVKWVVSKTNPTKGVPHESIEPFRRCR